MRVTKNELDAMLGRLGRSLRRHLLLGPDQALALEHGSKTNGNAYRVVILGEGRRYEPFGTLSFGFTARDCYDRMHACCVTMEML